MDYEAIPTSPHFKVGLVWLTILLLVGVFPALYAISSNMSGDNTLSVSKVVLNLIQHSYGVIMYGIIAVLVPMLVVRKLGSLSQ